MKLLNLHLIAFGCFTNTRLDFAEQGRDFHVIYGENEAGKSTALRALTGLFYGIPAKTPDAFLHQMKDLRVAGELERADGKRLIFVRRKGNRDTLLDQNGKPLPDALLVEFLGGASEEIFTTMFRLDHASLVRGGEDLLAGEGHVAESLFEAGTGITGLRQALAALEAEVEQLFKPRSGTALVNRAIDAYEEARKRSRDLSVPPKQWTEQSEGLKAKEEELKSLKTQVSELSACRERLNRFRLTLPHVTRRKELLLQLESLGTVTPLPESAPRDREEAERRQRDARRRMEEADAKLAALREELKGVQFRQELLDNADTIAGLYERLDSYRQAMRDLPKMRAEQHQFEADAHAILREVKPGLPLKEAEALRLTVVQRTRIRELVAQHHALQERLRGAAERAESACSHWEEKKHALEQSPAPRDVGELERAIQRARKKGDLEATLREETDTLRAAEEQGASDLKRLPLWSGVLEQLETLPVPTLETIERVDAELSALVTQQNLLDNQREDNRERLAKVGDDILALRLGGEVPTEQDLRRARAHREQGWKLVRRAWLEGASDAEAEKAFDPERPLPEAYEMSVTEADATGDRLRREADRVAKLAGLLADKEGCESRAAELETKQSELTTRLEACEQQWHEAWQPAGIAPLSPKEMRAWLNRHTVLLAHARDMRTRRQAIAQLRERIREHSEELNGALAALGDATRGEVGSLDALIQRSEAVLRRLKEDAQRRTELENEVRRSATEHEKAKRERDSAQRDLEIWQADWQQAIAPLGLPADARAEEAVAVMDKLDALFKKLDDSQNLLLRVQQMQQHVDQFNADMASLAKLVAPELNGLPPDQAAIRLQSLLNKDRQDAVRHQSIEKQIEEEQKALQAADHEIKDASNELQELMRKAHCSDLVALEDAERKSTRSRELTRQLVEVNKTLAGFAAGATVEAFLDEVAEVDPDQLPFQIDECERQTRELEDQRSRLEQQIGRERAALQATDGSEQAALAAEEAQSALAAVRAHADRYLRLRLASEVLRRYIDRYREQNQDPVIKRAGEIFPRLTLNSFARLKAGFDEKDRPVLLGVRSSGDEVEVSGMSDGTRDQLFLALRLASLERQLASGEPLPFVVDDILIKFDDDRAAATLVQLADLTERTQVLFFTHHSHLVELAQTVIPRDLLKIHRLDNRQGLVKSSMTGNSSAL